MAVMVILTTLALLIALGCLICVFIEVVNKYYED